jgi:cytochrome P450
MAATEGEPVFFNPLEPGYAKNPYPHLRLLREQDPVHHSPLGMWVLFGYDDVFAILRDASMSVEDENITVGDLARREQFDAIAREEGGDPSNRDHAILNIDPPDHTRLRKLLSQGFTPRTIERLRPRVQELVDEALDRAEGSDRWDLVPEMAFPLPFQVISEMLGMPDGDRDQIRDWSHTLTRTLDPIIDEDEIRAAVRASLAMNEYLADVIEWKREHPGDDVLTTLLEAEADGDRLSPEELRAQLVLLFIAGHETTVNLIGNGTLALLRNRDQFERWRDDPSLDANAVDELLRYDSPVQMSRRITLRDIEIGGREIEAGSFVMTSLASANRDPAHWGPDVDELDLGREGAGQHVGFGSGAHYCLGASLARLEAQVAVGTMVRRFPRLELAGDPVQNGRITLRGLDSLPLSTT